MQLFTVIIAMTATFSSTTLASPMLERTFAGLASRQNNNAQSPQQQQVMANMSSAFGWAMAGSALSDNQLDATCANITNTGHHKWTAEGLMPEYIVEPICNASHSNPNATVALPWTILYNSEVFITQLTNAFAPDNANAALTYLCNNLRFVLLDSLHLMDARITNATCSAAGLQAPPRPAQAAATSDAGVTNAYVNTASTLYGLIFASAALSDSQLNIYCAHAPEYVPSLNAMMLNGTLVQETLCNVTETMSIGDGVSAITTWSTRLFITIIENASNVSGWLNWLCDNLNADAMESVGLDGQAVQTQVCGDAKCAASS